MGHSFSKEIMEIEVPTEPDSWCRVPPYEICIPIDPPQWAQRASLGDATEVINLITNVTDVDFGAGDTIAIPPGLLAMVPLIEQGRAWELFDPEELAATATFVHDPKNAGLQLHQLDEEHGEQPDGQPDKQDKVKRGLTLPPIRISLPIPPPPAPKVYISTPSSKINTPFSKIDTPPLYMDIHSSRKAKSSAPTAPKAASVALSALLLTAILQLPDLLL